MIMLKLWLVVKGTTNVQHLPHVLQVNIKMGNGKKLPQVLSDVQEGTCALVEKDGSNAMAKDPLAVNRMIF